MRRVAWLSLLGIGVVLAAASACKRAPAGDAPGTSASAQAAPLGVATTIEQAELDSVSAFDLAARPDGLRLLWASPGKQAGWLRELPLAQDGSSRAQAKRVELPARSLGHVTDLNAVYVGDRLALAWLEQGQSEARAQATLIEAGSAAPSALDLGAAAAVAEAARGNIAIAGEPSRGRALVMWRGLETPCVSPGTAPCTGFSFRRLTTTAAESTGLPLSVPVPCASHSVELATAEGRFHYGVCTKEGADPVTTMFSIQYDPEYARAEPLLKGCLPLGTVDVADRAWLVGDCHGRRRAVPVPLGDERVEVESIDALAIACTPRRLQLSQGRFRLTLEVPRASLESVLPSNLVPSGARAGWTGSTLLVAYATGQRLQMRRFVCQGGKLEAAP